MRDLLLRQLREILGRIFLEGRLTAVATKFDLLPLVDNLVRVTHRPQLLAGNEARFERVRFRNYFGSRHGFSIRF